MQWDVGLGERFTSKQADGAHPTATRPNYAAALVVSEAQVPVYGEEATGASQG